MPLAVLLPLVLALLTWGAVSQASERQLRVDISTVGEIEQLLPDLLALGLEIEVVSPQFSRIQGLLPAERLDDLTHIPGVLSVAEPTYGMYASGAALSEGDRALNAALARSQFDVDGAGVSIAVLSDGILGLAQAIRAGEAPRLIEARPFGAGDVNRGQEGTAMIEIVHDLAPGASVSFGAVLTDLDLIAAVNYFAAKVDIIVDDISFAYPSNQQSDVSQNTAAALKRVDWPLRLYVTAAGNWGESHWVGDWSPGVDGRELGLPSAGATQQFSDEIGAPLKGAGNGFLLEANAQIRVALFWDDEWGRSNNDYDLYLLSASGEILGRGESRQGIGINSHTPRELLSYQHRGADTQAYIVLQNHNDDAEPVQLEVFVFHIAGLQVQLDHRSEGGSILAQSDSEGAITVGAVNAGQSSVAAYSSRGPTANGAFKPELVAVDFVTVSDTTHFAPRFLGSSAAAPHVAAVGALLLEAQPALSAADGGNALLERELIRQLLLDTAKDIPPVGRDFVSGAGLIDAEAAVRAADDRIAVVSSNANDGPGTLREAILSGASIILCSQILADQTVRPLTPLPPLESGAVLDATGWTIDASGLPFGLVLGQGAQVWGLAVRSAEEAGVVVRGEGASLHHVVIDRNQLGVRVDAADVRIVESTISRNQTDGIVVLADAELTLRSSLIDKNERSGVAIDARAGHVRIGPTAEPPQPTFVSQLTAPIDPLYSRIEPLPVGEEQTIVGYVSIDGLPRADGVEVRLYLDRRQAATTRTNQFGQFRASVAGPGDEIRFMVNGTPSDQRIKHRPGETTQVTLRAAHSDTQIPAQTPASGANVIRDNAVGIAMRDSGSDATSSDDQGQSDGLQRQIWGNVLSGNEINIDSSWDAPLIDGVVWHGTALSLSGRALGADSVHLYAGSGRQHYYVAATEVVDGRYVFSRLMLDRDVTEFSVIAHHAGQQASRESEVHREPVSGVLTRISPRTGYQAGGDEIALCGAKLASDNRAPTVWFGGYEATVQYWSRQCVHVTSPAGPRGSVDVVVQQDGGRAMVAESAFTYLPERVVPLTQGWNLVEWQGDDTRITNALASLAGLPLRVYAWDSEQQTWRLFATELPASLNTLKVLRRDMSLWVFLDAPSANWIQPLPA